MIVTEHRRLQKRGKSRGGFALVLALVLLMTFATLAAAVMATADRGLRQSSNLASGQRARMAAESGLEYVRYILDQCDIPPGVYSQLLIDSLASEMDRLLTGTPTLGGGAVGYDGSVIRIPRVRLANDCEFQATLSLVSRKTVRVLATGYDHLDSRVKRTVRLDFETTSTIDGALLSKGPIAMGDNLDLVSAGDALDGSITCAAPGDAVTLYGASSASGNVNLTDPTAGIVHTGSFNVGGAVQTVDPVAFPAFDTSSLVPLAVNIVDSGTDFEVAATWRNIRVKAGTNPTFDAPASIEGVMYIEAPNVVTFLTSLDITGVIITEDPGAGASLTDHQICFSGEVYFHEPSTLPDLPEFELVRQLTGSYILAPGFLMYAQNNVTGPIGVIAAEGVQCDNTLMSTVYGMIIAYGDYGITMDDDCLITVDRAGWASGDLADNRLRAVPDTYAEVIVP